jgi:hypothetical protein
VSDARARFLAGAAARGAAVVVLDIPLLFEKVARSINYCLCPLFRQTVMVDWGSGM